MRPLSFTRHRLPADVIRQAIWLYFRFTLSFRDVEDLLTPRGIDVSYETIRCWTIKFGPQGAGMMPTSERSWARSAGCDKRERIPQLFQHRQRVPHPSFRPGSAPM